MMSTNSVERSFSHGWPNPCRYGPLATSLKMGQDEVAGVRRVHPSVGKPAPNSRFQHAHSHEDQKLVLREKKDSSRLVFQRPARHVPDALPSVFEMAPQVTEMQGSPRPSRLAVAATSAFKFHPSSLAVHALIRSIIIGIVIRYVTNPTTNRPTIPPTVHTRAVTSVTG